ncbi:hypothetical protein [Alkalihalophilus marmarensis]|nr:hypothetical protein [Alkalihalophilus marmarensis]
MKIHYGWWILIGYILMLIATILVSHLDTIVILKRHLMVVMFIKLFAFL